MAMHGDHYEYNKRKTELARDLSINVDEITIRSKYDLYEHGEKCSLFLSLVKSAIQGKVRTIVSMKGRLVMKLKSSKFCCELLQITIRGTFIFFPEKLKKLN